jgi:carboxypeptidase C (cathepsin A)
MAEDISTAVNGANGGAKPANPTTSPSTAARGVTSCYFVETRIPSGGSVAIGGAPIPYTAVAGSLVIHPDGWDDAAWAYKPESKCEAGDAKKPPAEASMFYVAYFKDKEAAPSRPVTFLFNGGPGSSTVWLHMGAFGPKRVDVPYPSHSPSAPYKLTTNDYSLLDVSDLVFIDAPGTGFSRVAGDSKDEKFYGVDEDAHAFAEFIVKFLSRYDRWTSPKYLLGESYGTTRAAVLVRLLQKRRMDVNGVIMLSQALAWDLWPDHPETTPGNEGSLIEYAAISKFYRSISYYDDAGGRLELW